MIVTHAGRRSPRPEPGRARRHRRARRGGPRRRRERRPTGRRRRPRLARSCSARVVRDTWPSPSGWNDGRVRGQGLDPWARRGGEELLAGVGVVARLAQQLRPSLREIAATAARGSPARCATCPAAVSSCGVVPRAGSTGSSSRGSAARSGCSPGVTRDEVEAGQAAAYRDPEGHRGVVAGARRGQRRLARARTTSSPSSSSRAGWSCSRPTRSTTTSSSTGSARCARSSTRACCASCGAARRPARTSSATRCVDEVHVTGSDKTYDAIVFGPGDEGARRKARGRAARDQARHRRARQRLAGHRRARARGARRTSPTRPPRRVRCSSTTRASTASRRACSSPGGTGRSATAFLNELECVLSYDPDASRVLPGRARSATRDSSRRTPTRTLLGTRRRRPPAVDGPARHRRARHRRRGAQRRGVLRAHSPRPRSTR